jgi:VPDSG-CTERM motif
MKLSKYLLAIAALTVALTVSAKADLSFLGAVDFNNGPNSPSDNLDALEAFGVDTTGFTLCGNFEELNGEDQNIDVMAGSFLVVHYGKGKGGTGSGGSLEFFQVINGETNVTVPGSPNANDPFATGGISSIREFCPPGTNVPDSGTTAMLLGSALTGLGLVRRYLKR